MGAPRRVATGLLAGALMIVGIAHAPAAGAADDVTSERVAGATRYGTAAAVSANAAFEGATTAILATGENFPDALAASGLAGSTAATPILLTQSDELSDEALAALDDLAVDDITVVGGTAAVSDDVITSLEDNGYTVERVAGADRYETAAAIADAAGAAGEVDGLVTALIATGENFPDALAGGPAAYAGNLPILLVNSDGVPAATEAALDDMGIEQAIVLGGTAAVSDDTAGDLATMTGHDVVRLAGENRFGTAAAVGEFEIDTLGFDGPDYILTTGVNFPDALSSGPLGGQLGAPIVLTASLPDESAQFLDDHSDIFDHQIVVGGTAAVDEETAAAGEAAAETTDNDTPTGGDIVTSDLVGPELQSASITDFDLDELALVYTFVFDQELDEDVTNPEAFKLYNYNTNDPATGDVFNDGDEMEIDGETAIVVFHLADFAAVDATLAAVEEGAVEDTDGNVNPPQSVEVSGLGNSAGTGLVSATIHDEDAGEVDFTFGSPQVPNIAGANIYELITRGGDTLRATNITAFQSLYPGTVETTPDEEEPSTTVRVTFECNGDNTPGQYADASLSTGNGETDDDPCSGADAGDGADLSGLNIRRVAVTGSAPPATTATRINTADIASAGITSAPDLVEVQLAGSNEDLEDNQALFIFDESIDSVASAPADANNFALVYSQCTPDSNLSVNDLVDATNAAVDDDADYQDGEGFDDPFDLNLGTGCRLDSTSAELGPDADEDAFSDRTVVVTFANDTIDNDFLNAAQVEENTVREKNDTDGTQLFNDDDEVEIGASADHFDDGEVAGPQLIGADVAVDETFGGDFDHWTLTLTFDKDLDDASLGADGAIEYWYEDDGQVEQDSFDLGTDCEVDDDTTIVCEIDDEDSTFADAVLVSVDYDTVLSTDDVTLSNTEETVFPNPEASISIEVPEAPAGD